MKIKTDIDLKTLEALNDLFKNFESIKPKNIEQKISYSILLKVCDTITTKYKTMNRQTTIFSNKKKISFTFEFFQAAALKRYLQFCYDGIQSQLDQVKIHKLIGQLDQKMLE